MCGIVGYIGPNACVDLLVDGLRRLEYRGYDSAGVAVVEGGAIQVVRSVGKLGNLTKALRERAALTGTTGIGHTRWATHGRPNETNAHPHVAGGVAVVHNGIIENHLALKHELQKDGVRFASDTDTEIVAHLVQRAMAGGASLEQAARAALQRLEGAYAVAILSKDAPGQIVVAKNSSPLVIGLGEGETYCASDIPAILSYTRNMLLLEDGEMAVLDARGAVVTTLDGRPVERAPRVITWNAAQAEKGGFKHFMLKEIHEQPRAVEDTLRGRIDLERWDVEPTEMGVPLDAVQGIDRVYFLACGTSHHATLYGRHLVEALARIPAVTELASEFVAREAVVGPRDLVVAVSQSGETIDTLSALKAAKERGARTLAVVNVVDSAIARAAHGALYTHAGPEIGVASTKCFTTQLSALVLLATYLGRRRDALAEPRAREVLQGLLEIPHRMREVLAQDDSLRDLARRYQHFRSFLFLGRGVSHAVAVEGALKLKEISYIHAEGYAAGEMKHGPIALIDPDVPVVVVMPRDRTYEKVVGNLQEVKAREAKILAVATRGDAEVGASADHVFYAPAVDPLLTPFVTMLPLQLLAYYVADLKGTDVDQPRNLAKTVTVE